MSSAKISSTGLTDDSAPAKPGDIEYTYTNRSVRVKTKWRNSVAPIEPTVQQGASVHSSSYCP